jgi:acyl-coenzyme A thioesterase PaaI-like protein
MAPAEAPAAGDLFLMTGTVTRAGRTLVVCRGDAFADSDATPCAVTQATLTAVYDRPGVRH